MEDKPKEKMVYDPGREIHATIVVGKSVRCHDTAASV